MNTKAHVGRIAAAAVALAAFAGMGSGPADVAAIPVLCPIIIGQTPPSDPVRITAISYDLGSGGLDGTEPAGCGTLSWDIGGNTVTPHLEATLYAKSAIGTTARVVLRHYDIHDTLLDTTRGARHEIGTNGVEEFPISLGAYSNPLTYRVDVEIQVELQGNWVPYATETEHLASSDQPSDPVRVENPGQDFGVGPLVNGAPSGDATLSWDLSGNNIRAQLDGEILLKNSLGTRARVEMHLYDVYGNELGSPASSAFEATSNALQTFPVSFGNVSSPFLYRAVVELQVDVGGTWTPVGTPVTALI